MTLLQMQRGVAAALMTPLTPAGGIARKTKNGARMSSEAARFIKPNDRLTSLERLEIYSKSYWYRLMDSLRDDFPGLAGILGGRAFEQLAKAYLSKCPSRSFTLRDLGAQLEDWLRKNPKYAGRKHALALDMVRLEWAHILAFDGPEEKVLGQNELATLNSRSRVGVQPYLSLLDLAYPVDQLRVKGGVKSAAPESIFVAVHRFDLVVHYRRLVAEEFHLLQALRAGNTIAAAIRRAFRESPVNQEEIPSLLQKWFRIWAELGWLTL